jgi:hypothetical protein
VERTGSASGGRLHLPGGRVKTREALVIAGKEPRLLRTGAPLAFAFVLPLLVYPVVFFALGKLDEIGKGEGGRGPRPSVAGDAAGLSTGWPIPTRRSPPPRIQAAWLGDLDALVVTDGPRPDDIGSVSAVIYHAHRPSSDGATARGGGARAERDRLSRRAPRPAARPRSGEGSWRRPGHLHPSERTGAGLARFLPFILVALLLTGGVSPPSTWWPAKERGTLRRSSCSPSRRQSSRASSSRSWPLPSPRWSSTWRAWGRIAMGLGPPGAGAGTTRSRRPGSWPPSSSCRFPLTVHQRAPPGSAFARSYREAQVYLFLCAGGGGPALLAASPDIHSRPEWR